ncbi:LytR/AlgR family response regulator transcription factor [Raoultibacter phocaeensis]|uniref:LytR/AlgR family response regulator transcription factor n=1 Tax=Raoultibacter phocaeensis TaxID=2479841 RepID=UPI0015D61D73|nr:LytTR family DNA-binding domain-containing protein [Raoultibacter phocaeensis]
MTTIALCDDDPRDLARIAEAIGALQPHDGDELLVFPFASPLKLLDHVERQGPFDVYLLDIIMPGSPTQGIEAARRIRELDEDACIVFLTVSPEFALDAFSVHPFDYLLKPVEPARLKNVLDKALKHREADLVPSVVVKTAAGLVRLPLNDIVYAETDQRAVRYHLRKGDDVRSLTRRTSFKEAVAPLLGSGRFVCTSSSHAVNLHFIETMGKTALRLSDGTELPLTRLQAEGARRAWLEHWLDGGEGAKDAAGPNRAL